MNDAGPIRSLGLEPGDLVLFRSIRWVPGRFMDELRVYLGSEYEFEGSPWMGHMYRFMDPYGLVFKYTGTPECEVVSRVAEALG